MELKLIDQQGKSDANVAATDEVFGRDYNEALIHQVVIAYLANGRRARARRKTAAKSVTRPRSRFARKARAVHAPV